MGLGSQEEDTSLSSGAWVSVFGVHQSHLLAAWNPRVSEPAGLGRGLRTCLSNKVPSEHSTLRTADTDVWLLGFGHWLTSVPVENLPPAGKWPLRQIPPST